MPTDGAHYAIGDLAGLAGATPRTIRYYVAQGLLPPPVGVGPGSHYTDDHLGRLRLIRRLQRQHQPLSEIRQQLATLGEAEVAALVADDAEDGAPPESALEYLRTLLSTPSASAVPAAPALAAPSLAAVPPAARLVARALRSGAAPLPFMEIAEAPPAYESAAMPAMRDVAEPDAPIGEQRSQWDRIGLTPNIEIHVRRPLGRLENKRVERLITIARQLLREEQP